jgi:hypothetical protein
MVNMNAVETISQPEIQSDRTFVDYNTGLQLRERVNLIIHEGFTDMWLLLTGEELDDLEGFNHTSEGRPMAMFWGGQMRILTSRFSALGALRDLGIDMS